jgi:hypothetical protein
VAGRTSATVPENPKEELVCVLLAFGKVFNRMLLHVVVRRKEQ